MSVLKLTVHSHVTELLEQKKKQAGLVTILCLLEYLLCITIRRHALSIGK